MGHGSKQLGHPKKTIQHLALGHFNGKVGNAMQRNGGSSILCALTNSTWCVHERTPCLRVCMGCNLTLVQWLRHSEQFVAHYFEREGEFAKSSLCMPLGVNQLSNAPLLCAGAVRQIGTHFKPRMTHPPSQRKVQCFAKGCPKLSRVKECPVHVC